jgi:hypothetical protein
MQLASFFEFLTTAIKAAPTERVVMIAIGAAVAGLILWKGFDFRITLRPIQPDVKLVESDSEPKPPPARDQPLPRIAGSGTAHRP